MRASARTPWSSGGTAFALFLLSLGAGLGSLAGAAPATALEDEEEADEDEDEDEEEPDRWFAITGGDVHTGTGGVLRGATILAKNGVIEAIGHDLFLPEETETLDASGMRVYPGLVALSASSRISGGLFAAEGETHHEEDLDPHHGLDRWVEWAYGAQAEEGEDEAGTGWSLWGDSHVEPPDEAPSWEPLGDDHRIADSFDPFSQYLVLALATGITTAEQSGAAVKLERGEIDDVVMSEGRLKTLSWSTSNPSGIAALREKFAVAAEYLRAFRAWDALGSKEKKEIKEPKRPRGFDSTAFEVLRGDVLARFNVNDRQDLLGVARFAQEFGFRPVIFGCREGWTVAGELGRAGATAVISPRARLPKNERLRRDGGSSIENAALLHASGVQVAIVPENTGFDLGGTTGRDLMHLPVEAAFGVRGGLSEAAALAAISIVPARVLGVDHRVGTLEEGKDLDAIVTDGDLLHYQTFVQWAVVAGKLVYDKQEEIFFAHIRPRPEKEEAAVEGEAEPAEAAESAEADED